MARLAKAEPPRQVTAMGLARVDGRLGLRVRDPPLTAQGRRQDWPVGRSRWCDGRHRAGFDQGRGMRPGIGQDDPRQGVRLVQANVATLPRPGCHLIGQGRCCGEETQTACGQGETTIARGQNGRRIHYDPPAGTRGPPWPQARQDPGRRFEVLGLVEEPVPRRGSASIHDQQSGLDRGAVPGEGARREGDSGRHSAVSLKRTPEAGIRKSGKGHDRRQPPTVSQGFQRRDEMGLEVREGRIADRNVKQARVREEVRQMTTVVASTCRAGEKAVEERGARRRDLVQREPRSTSLGDHGQKTRSRRGFKDEIAWSDLGGENRQGGEFRRGRELVERDLFLAAPAVGQAERGDAGEQGRDPGRRIFQPRDLGSEAANLEHGRGFDRVIGVTPGPAALGIGRPEGGGHDLGHQTTVERSRSCELDGERPRGGQDVGGRIAGCKIGEQGEAALGRHHGAPSPGAEGASLSVLQVRLSPPFLPPWASDTPVRHSQEHRPGGMPGRCLTALSIRRRRSPGPPVPQG